MSKIRIPLRIVVTDPPPGVAMQIQKGRDELLPPIECANGKLVFGFEVEVELETGVPNFLGKFAQGPKGSRFIYLNSGTYAGQAESSWGRRAKVSLMDVTADQVRQIAASPGRGLEISVRGTGTDGGPICASVKPHATSGWKVSE